MSASHNIVDDTTTYPRLTCTHCKCQTVRQPFMGDLEWNIAVERFRTAHGDCTCGSVSGAHKMPCKMVPEKYRS